LDGSFHCKLLQIDADNPANHPPVTNTQSAARQREMWEHTSLYQSALTPTHRGVSFLVDFGFDSLSVAIRAMEALDGQGVTITRTDCTSGELRALSRKCRNGAQVRRLLAVAIVLDGAPRTEAACCNGVDRQTLRDWVHRHNEGPSTP
jgi:hypothetical protein